MNDWRHVLLTPETTILQALEIIDKGVLRLGLVVDPAMKLLGMVTDGDVRRGLLRRLGLDAPVAQVMSTKPVVARESDSKEWILALMRGSDLIHIPIVDAQGRVVNLITYQELARPGPRDNPVVLMAGGLGSRLAPLTQECPKPLLKIGSKPILEIILESFVEAGFRHFYFSVNYRKQMIHRHFGNGEKWGVSIQYVEEPDRLGTAGSLALLPEKPRLPFFVMNGDLLTKIDFGQVLSFHHEHQSKATMCVRKVEQAIPYGVVDLDGPRLLNIVEKPVEEYFVNAGIYLLDPVVLSLIPPGSPLDMPDLFRMTLERGLTAAAFPFLEYWLDIGRMGDFQQACQDYAEEFA
ncbi:MAG: nucleotidyltransferase family protein [Magnetococcales bacterium]|nr:nucleotidyltransferase family protein [Magnetococcales bacterium]